MLGFLLRNFQGPLLVGGLRGGTSEFPGVHSIPGGRQGLGDNEVREDGSLIGQAQGLQAEAAGNGDHVKVTKAGVGRADQSGSFHHGSVCPGHITRAPTVCTALFPAL